MEQGVACIGSDLCQELSGDPNVSFMRVYNGDPPSRLILRTENLSLIADISPLSVGHLLLVPHRHYYSFAGVVRDHGAELHALLEAVHDQYTATFGTPLVFEHGSTRDMRRSACITHAHWHYLPIPVDAVDRIISRDGLERRTLSAMADLATLPPGVPYFYRATRDDHVVYGVGQTARRQYLRSVAAEVLGIPDPEWDWAAVIRKDLLRETMNRVRDWYFVDRPLNQRAKS